MDDLALPPWVAEDAVASLPFLTEAEFGELWGGLDGDAPRTDDQSAALVRLRCLDASHAEGCTMCVARCTLRVAGCCVRRVLRCAWWRSQAAALCAVAAGTAPSSAGMAGVLQCRSS